MMHNKGFAARLRDVAEGKCSFSVFAIETRASWYRIARYLLTRWNPGYCVAMDDVVQDLLVAAWEFIPKWDVTTGVPLERYVVWNACDKAKKKLHTMRGVKRPDGDRVPSYQFVYDTIDTIGAREESKREIDDRVLKTLHKFKPASLRDRCVVVALERSQGDFGLAEVILTEDPAMRFVCDWQNDEEALRVLRNVTKKIFSSGVTSKKVA